MPVISTPMLNREAIDLLRAMFGDDEPIDLRPIEREARELLAKIDAAHEEQQQLTPYRCTAFQMQKDGDIEVDPDAVVSLSDDPGAYVQSWLWVYDSDVRDAGGKGCTCGQSHEVENREDDSSEELPEGHCIVCGKHAADGSHSGCVIKGIS